MNKIKIVDITNIDKIRNGEFINDIPEFYELREVIENNTWHNKESVFNHSLAVLENVCKVIDLSKRIEKKLSEILDNNSREDTLMIAAFLHDIAKKEKMVIKNGFANSPGHDRAGAKKTKGILKRIDVSDREAKTIEEIIRNHHFFHDHFVLGNKDFLKEHKIFKKDVGKIYLKLVILALADTMGYLEKSIPDEFRRRTDFYKKILSDPKRL